MEFEIFGYFLLTVITCAAVIAFIGSLKSCKGTPFFNTKLMLLGSFLFLLGVIFSIIAIGLEKAGSSFQISNGVIFGILFGLVLLLGPLFFMIGFVSFCARWGATGKRIHELREITAALTAIKSAHESASNAP